MDGDEEIKDDEELADGEVSLDALRDKELDEDELVDLEDDDDAVFGSDELTDSF